MDIQQANKKNIRIKEVAYREIAISSFSSNLVVPCRRVREAIENSNNQCCNNFNCCDAFGSPTELKNEIRHFRETLWLPPIQGKKWGPSKRKETMIRYLESCKYNHYYY
jgi:hypothetical protein